MNPISISVLFSHCHIDATIIELVAENLKLKHGLRLHPLLIHPPSLPKLPDETLSRYNTLKHIKNLHPGKNWLVVSRLVLRWLKESPLFHERLDRLDQRIIMAEEKNCFPSDNAYGRIIAASIAYSYLRRNGITIT